MPTAPLVTVLVAVHNGERYLRSALESILRQTVSDLELLVVDDGSTDSTASILDGIDDGRLRVLRNNTQSGLATSLNRGLDQARGRYVARMDADDVAFPEWLERSLELLRASSEIGFVGGGVLDIDEDGRPLGVHLHERGRALMRWRALFSAPVFHFTVVLERALLEAHGLRYDPTFAESEDYDLWTRLLEHTDGDTVEEPLVLHRLHPGQATQRRPELQRRFARDVALRQIAALVPELSETTAELAWRFDRNLELPAGCVAKAAAAYIDVHKAFGEHHAYSHRELWGVGQAVARTHARWALESRDRSQVLSTTVALVLNPLLPVRLAKRSLERARLERAARKGATTWLAELGGGRTRLFHVAAVFPEPTPYRTPLLDRIAALDEVELTVLYAAPTVARRTWHAELRHRATYLRGVRVPGAERVLHHDYPVTPGVAQALSKARPDVVVVSGWSTFAAQGAILWCRVRKVPYVLVVESHDIGPRPGWRRHVKDVVVPPIVRGAAGVLVTGTLARRSMIERGAPPESVHVFANTIDVVAFGEHADRLAPGRSELREELGVGEDDVVVLSVARLVPEKGHDMLVRAVAAAREPRHVLVLAGDGPERSRLQELALELRVRLVLAGDTPWKRIVEVYAAADVFALLSEREPWGVVVNEAAACGLPLVLSDRVGAAHDLLQHGENGFLVTAGDVDAAAAALDRLASDPEERRRMGARSREIVGSWGYEPSVAGFLAAVRAALADSVAR